MAVVILLAVLYRNSVMRGRDESQEYWARQADRLERIAKLLEPTADKSGAKRAIEESRGGPLGVDEKRKS